MLHKLRGMDALDFGNLGGPLEISRSVGQHCLTESSISLGTPNSAASH